MNRRQFLRSAGVAAVIGPLALNPEGPSVQAEIHIGPSGDDLHPATRIAPVRTLTGALQLSGDRKREAGFPAFQILPRYPNFDKDARYLNGTPTMTTSLRASAVTRCIFCSAAALMVAIPYVLAAQTPAPSPSRPIDSQTNDTQQPTDTFKVSVQRVILDITVTDANGKPVTGLTQSDFHIAEDGAPQSIRSFEVHTAEPQPPVTLPKLPTNTFSNFSSAPTGGPVTVILYDLLNTPQDAQLYAHQQLLDFLKKRGNSGQVAVFVLTDKLHMLQGFTEDDDKLIAALNLQKAKGYRSGLLQSSGEATQASDMLGETASNAAATTAGQMDVTFETVSNMLKNMQVEESSYLLDRRVVLTTEALQEIARFLIGLPGRKNLIWLSGSFPEGIIPNAGVDGQDPQTGREEFEATRNYSSDIVAATDLLNASHIGCGPGPLAIGFAPFVGSCTALDPEAAMIEAAREAAEVAGVHVALHLGRIEDFPAGELFSVVTIGRALHWLDRGAALEALERIVSERGRVLVCGATSTETPASPWLKPYQDLQLMV